MITVMRYRAPLWLITKGTSVQKYQKVGNPANGYKGYPVQVADPDITETAHRNGRVTNPEGKENREENQAKQAQPLQRFF